ncbi:hypothetical protein RJ639_037001 [Escallonia herrerae]|uniref:Leucine-rich repeat-containing N-terminal plant-type domain-containing protein n=1 Tax=Escallonia herrerae TaxID=1293975 RepID=A0AA88WU47_9ASTE|nr:hypothetical protein RJ639_037001 [Escallonia herrerae]
MRNTIFSWLFLILFQILLGIGVVLVSGQCLDDQLSLLLRLKNSLEFNPSFSTKLVSWNQDTNCSSWKGVRYNKTGYVIGLDLNNESISCGIDSSSNLFSLQFLQSLNLAFNNFSSSPIPPRFRNLASLTYLNLSNSGFTGQIPIDLSRLTRLATLDLSTLYFPGVRSLVLQNPDLAMLVQNMTDLTQLYLDGVNISAQGYDWCQAISSSLPNLGVLSMSSCYLSGPIDSSLAKLRSLSVIRLDQNNLSSPVPQLIADFKNLTALRLASCNLNGVFPAKIFELPALQTLDVSYNGILHGSLPEFTHDSPLQTLVLSYTNFTGALPYSFGNLGMLSRLDLSRCNFSGPIPNAMANLTQLVYLDMSSNKFTGPIPSYWMSKNLTHIDLSHNALSGPLLSTNFEGLRDLVYIDLRFNAFNGSIPSSLFALPTLQKIQLSNNHFDGLLAGFSEVSMLDTLDLSSNKLQGPIPKSFFDLKRLNILQLSSNNLTGTIQLESLHSLGNLTTLDLSYNNLSIEISGSDSSFSSPLPQITTLKLASCNLKNFPDLRNQSRMFYLDISNNQIGGEVPNWIWNVGSGTLSYLNLSCNFLVNLQEPYGTSPGLVVLDLHSNQLGGKIPVPPQSATYVDYSINNFSSSIPVNIGNSLTFAIFFSLSNNHLTGTIPDSICNASYLQVLDLSNNSLSGVIPSCLTENITSLGVLNLGRNNLHGNISRTFSSSCGLKTLDLHDNLLEGMLPESLGNCKMLEVLNLGNNKISDNFPCFLRNCSNLRVLALRSNMFHGGIKCGKANESWSKLQIVDIASNNFTGNLPPKCFLTWSAMMTDEDDAQSKLNHLRFDFLQLTGLYYLDTVTVTNKGLDMELVKILTVFTSLDVSNNRFEGDIPDNIGVLKSLYVLNLSHNVLTGSIPSSIGNLTQLGSLDLSVNKLFGLIPAELAGLTFLSVLNLSHNHLSGRIPTGRQLQTFSEDSFEGNEGLCGSPLNRSCSGAPPPAPSYQDGACDSACGFDWQSIIIGLGFGVGAGVVLAPLMFWKQGRHWWDEVTDKFLFMLLPTFAYVHTSCNDVEEYVEDERSDKSGDPDVDYENEIEDSTFEGRYCVFCSKLDLYRKKVMHNPKCSCFSSTPVYTSSSSSSSFLRSQSH